VCAEKVDGECDKEHTGRTRHHVKSPVTTSAVLYHVYCTWEPPRRCIEAKFQLNGAPIHPWTGPCVPRKWMGSAIKSTQASTNIMLSPWLQRAQCSTTFIAPGTPTPLHFEATFQLDGAPIHPWTGPCVPRKWMGSAIKSTQASPDFMLSP
jgi:hypothetical protein